MSIILAKLKYRAGFFKKRKRKRYIYKNKKLSRRIKLIVCFAVSICALTYVFTTIESRINPLIYDMSISTLNSMVLRECNSAVNEFVASDSVIYDELINKTEDENGNLKSLSVDYKNLNIFKSRLAVDIQNRIDQINSVEVYIPVMSMLTDRFYSAVGFPVKIKVMTDENVGVQFYDEFISGGVNQTVHKIYVRIITEIGVNIPIRGNGDDVVTDIPIAETVIVGDVPETYIDFQ